MSGPSDKTIAAIRAAVEALREDIIEGRIRVQGKSLVFPWSMTIGTRPFNITFEWPLYDEEWEQFTATYSLGEILNALDAHAQHLQHPDDGVLGDIT